MTCLTPKSRKARCLTVTATSLLLCAGCEIATPQKPDRVNATVIVSDEATVYRSFSQTKALYPSFSTTTGPSGVMLVPSPKLTLPEQGALETPLFFVQVLLAPVALAEGCPWSQVETTMLYLPPTYTANPPLTQGRPNDYSGGPGTGYNPAHGRAVTYP
jgi:hypothetical protein